MSSEAEIRPFLIQDQVDLEKIKELLKRNQLPYQDLTLTKGIVVCYTNRHNEIVGSGALEFYGDSALLRSVAVEENQRGRAIGNKIVNDLIQRAKAIGTKAIYLLTETAHTYFLRRGFLDINREELPEEVKASSEVSSVCPQSAVCMVFEVS